MQLLTRRYRCVALLLLTLSVLLYVSNSILTSWLVVANYSRALNLTSLPTKHVDQTSHSWFVWRDGNSGTYNREKESNGPAGLQHTFAPSSLMTVDRKVKTSPWFVNKTLRNPDEVHHVVFVKDYYTQVHKAASTTLFNVFMRFAMSRGINVMLPKRSHILSQKNRGLGDLAPHPKSPPFLFDILCNHVVFNHTLVKLYFPLDTKYVGIIRHPWEQVKSAYHYYTTEDQQPYLKNACSFEDFILHHPELEPLDPLASYTNNRMSVDLGLPPNEITNTSYVTPFLRHLDDVFDLVLIADRFKESMVLLRRTFRWTMKDVVFLKLNSLKTKGEDHFQPDAETTRRFEQFAKFDVALYRHFWTLFDEKVAAEGKEFFEELDIFNRLEQQISEFCHNDTLHVKSLVVPANKWSKEFSVIRRMECQILSMEEIALNDVIRKRQLARFNEDVTKRVST